MKDKKGTVSVRYCNELSARAFQVQIDGSYVDVAYGSDDGHRNRPEYAQEPYKGCANQVKKTDLGRRLDDVVPDLEFVSIVISDPGESCNIQHCQGVDRALSE